MVKAFTLRQFCSSPFSLAQGGEFHLQIRYDVKEKVSKPELGLQPFSPHTTEFPPRYSLTLQKFFAFPGLKE
jgi:hypothetical protein